MPSEVVAKVSYPHAVAIINLRQKKFWWSLGVGATFVPPLNINFDLSDGHYLAPSVPACVITPLSAVLWSIKLQPSVPFSQNPCCVPHRFYSDM